MKPEILVVRETHRVHSPRFLTALAEHFTVHQLPAAAAEREATLTRVGTRVRALVTTTVAGADGVLIGALPGLEIIACSGGHADRVDTAAARARNIPITFTPHVSAVDVADHAVALLLAVAHRACEGDRFIRAGRWPQGSLGLGARVTGKRAGILGLGYIGRLVAKRLEAFEVKIAYSGPHRKPDVPYRYVADLGAMAAASDILIVTCATRPETRHVVNRPVLEALGPKGFLVSMARGVVDERDLVDVLAESLLGGAGLDVYDDEPQVPSALMAMDKVVLTPHNAALTVETKEGQVDLLIANLVAHFAGRPLPTPYA